MEFLNANEDSLHLANVVEAYENMKRAEQERDDWRAEFLTRLRNARDAGVTVAQVSRSTGVTSPNIFRMLRN